MEASAPERSEWTISHVMIETMINWGIRTVSGMVGHSNLGLAEADNLYCFAVNQSYYRQYISKGFGG